MTVGHISCCRFSLISIARASCSCRTAFLGLPFTCRMRAHWRCCAGVIKNLGPSFNAPALPSKAHSCDSHHIANAMAALHYPPSNGPQIAGNSPPSRSMEASKPNSAPLRRGCFCGCSIRLFQYHQGGDVELRGGRGRPVRQGLGGPERQARPGHSRRDLGGVAGLHGRASHQDAQQAGGPCGPGVVLGLRGAHAAGFNRM